MLDMIMKIWYIASLASLARFMLAMIAMLWYIALRENEASSLQSTEFTFVTWFFYVYITRIIFLILEASCSTHVNNQYILLSQLSSDFNLVIVIAIWSLHIFCVVKETIIILWASLFYKLSEHHFIISHNIILRMSNIIKHHYVLKQQIVD